MKNRLIYLENIHLSILMLKLMVTHKKWDFGRVFSPPQFRVDNKRFNDKKSE